MGGVSNYEKVRYERVPLPSLPGNHLQPAGLGRRRSQRKRQKSNRFRLAKQQPCTCSTHLSLLSLPDYDVKMPNFTFFGGREPKTTTFFISFFFPLLVLGWWCWWWLGSLSNNDRDGYENVTNKWIRAASSCIALIPSRWICRMLAIKVNCTAILFETSSRSAVVCSSPCKGKITFVAVYRFKVDQGLLVIYSYTCKCTLSHACFDFIAGFSDPSVCQRESW